MAATGVFTRPPARTDHELLPSSRTGARIAFLDGLRCVAILYVMLFHYFSRWTVGNHGHPLYPYSVFLGWVFALGGVGVWLFFIISGFVITLTLYKCASFPEFLARRFARLFPAMLACTLITFLVIRFLPQSPFQVHLSWILPSTTFSGPEIWNHAFSSRRFEDMDWAYWSLYVEVKFYLVVGIVYFLDRRHFLRNMIAFSALTFVIARIGRYWVLSSPLQDLLIPTHLFFEEYLPWFMIGIGAFYHFRRENAWAWRVPVVLGTVELIFAAYRRLDIAIVCVLVPGFFLAMNSRVLKRWLSLRPVTLVGVSSYSLYLLHQKIGVSLIHVLAGTLSLGVTASIALALAVALFMMGFSCLLYRFYEAPANRWIVGRLPRPVDRLSEPAKIQIAIDNASH